LLRLWAQCSTTGKYYVGEDAVKMSGQPGTETKWEKMSKSKGNGVDPTAIIREVGVDSTRLNILFKVHVSPAGMTPR
jgi:leucyl-tRNA synthetase